MAQYPHPSYQNNVNYPNYYGQNQNFPPNYNIPYNALPLQYIPPNNYITPSILSPIQQNQNEKQDIAAPNNYQNAHDSTMQVTTEKVPSKENNKQKQSNEYSNQQKPIENDVNRMNYANYPPNQNYFDNQFQPYPMPNTNQFNNNKPRDFLPNYNPFYNAFSNYDNNYNGFSNENKENEVNKKNEFNNEIKTQEENKKDEKNTNTQYQLDVETNVQTNSPNYNSYESQGAGNSIPYMNFIPYMSFNPYYNNFNGFMNENSQTELNKDTVMTDVKTENVEQNNKFNEEMKELQGAMLGYVPAVVVINGDEKHCVGSNICNRRPRN